MNLSLIVLTRNEENIVKYNLEKINDYLKNLKLIDDYEIIVSDFSQDSTLEIVKKMARNNPKIRPYAAPRKGIGIGIVTGANQVRYDYMMFYPIDMAWNISIIDESIKKMIEGFDVVLGSRSIKDSKTNRPIKRQVFSKLYNLIVNIFFNLKISDTQGTCALKKNDFLKYQNQLEDDGAFLQTEILIYSKINGLKIIEIPSIVTDLRKDSSIQVLPFALGMIKKVIRKKIKLIKER